MTDDLDNVQGKYHQEQDSRYIFKQDGHLSKVFFIYITPDSEYQIWKVLTKKGA